MKKIVIGFMENLIKHVYHGWKNQIVNVVYTDPRWSDKTL